MLDPSAHCISRSSAYSQEITQQIAASGRPLPFASSPCYKYLASNSAYNTWNRLPCVKGPSACTISCIRTCRLRWWRASTMRERPSQYEKCVCPGTASPSPATIVGHWSRRHVFSRQIRCANERSVRIGRSGAPGYRKNFSNRYTVFVSDDLLMATALRRK
jgi:hypothetical protein